VRAFSAEVFAFPAVTCCSDLLYSVRFRFLAQLPPVALISFHLLCQLISCRRLVFLCVLADLSAGLLTARVPACDFSSRSVLSLSCLLFCELGLVRPRFRSGLRCSHTQLQSPCSVPSSHASVSTVQVLIFQLHLGSSSLHEQVHKPSFQLSVLLLASQERT
jgi:hypothetical protein